MKGAFTESLKIFVEGAYKKIQASALKDQQIVVGEFGLGVGTNWLIWSLVAKIHGLNYTYWAIEKDLSAFQMGQKKWAQMAPYLADFIKKWPEILGSTKMNQVEGILQSMSDWDLPVVYPSVEAALSAGPPKAHIWFHDPFGYETNPEGYSCETLNQLQNLWGLPFFAFTYASNSSFQKNLQELSGIVALKNSSSGYGLKRESLEWCKT